MSANKSKVQFDTDHEASSKVYMPTTPVATERHPEFYFDDSLVVIQVENTLFRVHKYHLIKSETFSDMFKMPKGLTDDLKEGVSPEHPIVLDGVKSSDFAALLKVLYPVYFSNKKPQCEPEIIVPAFRLAHMWNFEDLRTHLLPLVKDSLGCVDKIVLARELGIQEWLAPAHVELCQRPESLSMAEATKLGMHSTLMITRLREHPQPPQPTPNSGCFWNYCDSCGPNPSIFKRGYEAGSCCRCRANTSLSSYYFQFPAPTSSTAPEPGSVWNYCHSCGHLPTVYCRHGEADCYKCGTHLGLDATYWRFTIPSSTDPPSGNAGLESQLKNWVEAGCVTD